MSKQVYFLVGRKTGASSLVRQTGRETSIHTDLHGIIHYTADEKDQIVNWHSASLEVEERGGVSSSTLVHDVGAPAPEARSPRFECERVQL